MDSSLGLHELVEKVQAPIRFLRRAEAANYVETHYGFPCSRQWLAKLAVVGGGPLYRKAGRTPIYAPSDLDRWAMDRIGAPQRSTSDVQSISSKSPDGDEG
ncbi:hypothetical protein [Microvirga puerhi]|uniref:DNA-binding protein n=1 Tax=Microvirga puerhi TaxID=2876078 RepID=A0ABS7VRD3_9HYPH|nr:hypothetical protein [Microvirga puerhi]MBZ6077572.1 hypothetical protein [Microvirga puerhi]